jgi:hypothetical protein
MATATTTDSNMKGRAGWPEFRLQVDPNDFAVPQVLDPDDERWQERGKSSRMHDMCR